MPALNVNTSAQTAKPKRATRFSPVDRSARTRRSAARALPTPKLKDFSMTLESLLSALASNNTSGGRITDLGFSSRSWIGGPAAAGPPYLSSSTYNQANQSVRLGILAQSAVSLRPDAERESNEIAVPQLAGQQERMALTRHSLGLHKGVMVELRSEASILCCQARRIACLLRLMRAGRGRMSE